MSFDYESVLCVKPEVQVFTKIPARSSNRGFRASEWKLDSPDWIGRLRIVARGKDCVIKLEDKTTGELFAEAPVEQFPSIAVEAVLDSSRYFVIRISDSGRKAFVGIGFTDRGDSFDFNVALQDHFKWLKQSKEIEEQEKNAETNPGPKLDLGFKEGQTIKINIGGKKTGTPSSRPRSTGGGIAAPGLLPPPPGGAKPPIQASPGALGTQSGGQSSMGVFTQQQQQQPNVLQQPNNNFGIFGGNNQVQSNVDLLGGFGGPQPTAQPMTQPMTQPMAQQTQQASTDWGDFTSAQSGGAKNSWVTF